VPDTRPAPSGPADPVAPALPPAGSAAPPAGRRPALAVLLTALVAFGPMSTDLYLPALPGLTRALGADIATGQLTLSVFLAGFAVSQLLYGPLSDRFGRRPVLLAGVAVFVLAGAACALAPTIEALIAFRFLQALGACAGPVIARAVVRDVWGREGAARVLAYMAMAMALAPAVGPILGGQLTVAFGWRANFWFLVGFGAVVLAASAVLLAETNRLRDPEAIRPARLARNYGVLFRHRAYRGYVAVVAFSYAGIFCFISGSSFLFVEAIGLSPDLYGLSFTVIVVGYMVGSFAAGRLTTRLGIARMIAIGTGLSAAGGAAMAACAAAGWLGVAPVVGPFFVFMVGAGLTLPNAMAGAVGPFPGMAGLASALLGFFQMGVAAVVGVAVGRATEAAFAGLAAGAAAPDRAGLPMGLAVALVSLAASAAYRWGVRPAGDDAPGTAAPGAEAARPAR